MSQDEDTPKYGIAVEQINVDAKQIDNAPNLEGLVVLPTKNVVLFPEVTISIALTREISQNIARQAIDECKPIGIVCQKDPEVEWPSLRSGLYRIGVVADVLKVMELPDGQTMAIVRGRMPFHIVGSGKKGIKTSKIIVKAELLADLMPAPDDKEFSTVIKNIRSLVRKSLNAYPDGLSQMLQAVGQEKNPVDLINAMSTNLPFETELKQQMLEERSIAKRAEMLLGVLMKREQEMQLNLGILSKVHQDLTEDQRRNFLQRQMDAIHDELYGDEKDDLVDLKNKAAGLQLSEEAHALVDKEMRRLERYSSQHPDYAIIYNYVDTILSLPWGKDREQNPDFNVARERLDSAHGGLKIVKERILEQIALMMHHPQGKSPILCLVGPPGVGKTSLGKSIASALGRDYQRVSLGGLHDEAEIRGHRRTYIGSMPGRIIDAMKRAGSQNPVLVLDEIDKLGSDYKGDPSSALLEVLDPEQNVRFHDNFIDVDFDLSHVFFIATANTLNSVPRPLLDRMEIIHLPGYTNEEKMDIARRYLLPRLLVEYNLTAEDFEITDETLKEIITRHTKESGVRQLDKVLHSLARKRIMAMVSNTTSPSVILPEHLDPMLGEPNHNGVGFRL